MEGMEIQITKEEEESTQVNNKQIKIKVLQTMNKSLVYWIPTQSKILYTINKILAKTIICLQVMEKYYSL